MKRLLDLVLILTLFRRVLFRAYVRRIVLAVGGVALVWLISAHQAQASADRGAPVHDRIASHSRA